MNKSRWAMIDILVGELIGLSLLTALWLGMHLFK